MALEIQRLKTKIKNALDAGSPSNQNNSEDNDPIDKKRDDFAEALALAIIQEIKQATIIYKTGLVAPPSGGAVTGTINHTIE